MRFWDAMEEEDVKERAGIEREEMVRKDPKTKDADLSRAQCVLCRSSLITGLTNVQRLAETNRRVRG